MMFPYTWELIKTLFENYCNLFLGLPINSLDYKLVVHYGSQYGALGLDCYICMLITTISIAGDNADIKQNKLYNVKCLLLF